MAMTQARPDKGLSLRAAAITAGLVLVMAVTAPLAEFIVFPELIDEDPGTMIQNIVSNKGLFASGIFALLLTYMADIVVAWALYILLVPASASLSLLTMLFRLIYTAMALAALFNYVEVYGILDTPNVATVVGADQLNAAIYFRMNAYQQDWGFSLIVFGVHLVFLGVLVMCSTYIPSILGIGLVIAGLAYVTYMVGLYYLPTVDLGFLFIAFLLEPVFMLWLLLFGWRLKERSLSE